MKKTETQQQKMRQPRLAYAGFLFQTFFKRPSGYIIPLLYVVFLSLILLIVPKIIKVGPLFIWTIGGFNMPVFNLFFIAAAAAALAVSIFRTGREDGTELCLSSKPLTKGTMVGIKVAVYIAIMLIICVISNIIALLTLPIFGLYDEVNNLKGIELSKYLGLNLSVLFGNLINMLLFGGISVLISMIGGQVATIVGSVGIVFVMCLMNFLYPQITTNALEILKNKYDTEVLSLTCNTLDQYEKQDKSGQKQYATIQCVTDTYGEELSHFDTNEYWLRAQRESGQTGTNYIDFARQLSSLYNAFGLDDSKLKEASKLSIGANNNFKYKINASTHVDDENTVTNKNYPVAYYGMTATQGMRYPQVLLVGGDMSISKTNWFAISTLNQYPFDSVSIVTNGNNGLLLSSKEIRQEYGTPFKRIYDLGLTSAQKTKARQLYQQVLSDIEYEAEYGSYTKARSTQFFQERALERIKDDTSGQFFEGDYSELTPIQQATIVSKIHFAWAIYAQERQNASIDAYCLANNEPDKFPYKTTTVNNWYIHEAETVLGDFHYEFSLGNHIFKDSIQCRIPSASATEHTDGYTKLVITKMDYAETYGNLYQYNVSSFYNVYTIMGIWSIVSIMFFTGSVIIYRKTDFK